MTNNYLCLKSLTYSSIAPRRKSYLNVGFHECFLHRWYCVIIGTRKIQEENNWYLDIIILYEFFWWKRWQYVNKWILWTIWLRNWGNSLAGGRKDRLLKGICFSNSMKRGRENQERRVNNSWHLLSLTKPQAQF